MTAEDILRDATVRMGLEQAWIDSQPGVTGGHETGGFIVLENTGQFGSVRWSDGKQDTVSVPSHPGGKVNGLDIAATFHTHPNTGSDYIQEPSETDKRAVRDDPNLKTAEYVGEFVISARQIYLIAPTGQIHEIGDTLSVFKGRL